MTNTYKHHRIPPDIISYAVWLYYRFNLSHRDIEDLLAERGITVSREAIRLWHPKHSLRSWGRLCIKFGAIYARRLKRKRRSYGVAHRELIPEAIHDNSQYANNRAVHNLFNLGRQLVSAGHYRNLRVSALGEWRRAVA